MIKLMHSFPSVRKDRTASYGGNQSWTRQKYVQKSGCGIISCTDLLLYLHRHQPGCSAGIFSKISDKKEIPLEEYNDCADLLRRRYLPVIPHFGMNGLVLVLGLNRYFRKYHIDFKAIWCISRKKLWRRMEQMLQADIPVIFAIGPDFPFVWQKHKLTFYKKKADGSFVSACQTNAHFVTVTAMDKEWIRISSWGKEYYINRKEYGIYVKKHSSFLVSNLVLIVQQVHPL